MILVVHAEKTFRHFLTSMIKDRLDQPVFGADSAREMIWHLKKIFFDIILINPNLKDRDGFELIEKIRKTHSRFEMPLILLAPASEPDLIVKGFQLGVNDCITTPLDPVVTIARIKNQIAMLKQFREVTAKNNVTGSVPGLGGRVHSETIPPTTQPSLPVMAAPEVPVVMSQAPTGALKTIQANVPFQSAETEVPTLAEDDLETADLNKTGETRLDAPHQRMDTIYHEEDPDRPIPCEMPASLFIGSRSFFCKTLWISRQAMLLLTFEEFSREAQYQVQLLDPQGGTVDLMVSEAQRQPIQGRGAGVLKLNLKIINAPRSFDDLYHLFQDAFDTDGIAGLKAVLRGEEVSSLPEHGEKEEKVNATMAFSTAASSLNIIKGTRYKFEKQVGKGGFASVFLVQDNALKRPVAMKVLNQDFSKVDAARYNFLCEAQIAAQFNHPNIVFVYEVGELFEKQYTDFLDFPPGIVNSHPDRLIYFTMQYVEGETLTRWIRSKKNVSVADCLNIMREIVKALAFAHGKGVIHRDVKPDNIMISADGHVQVMDFGIATLAKTSGEEDSEKKGKVEIACTPKYASPEQLRGKDLDGRSDIYSFGILAYEMFTGAAPFRGKSISEIVGKQLKARPKAISETRSDVKPALEDLIFKCLAKKAENRFQDAEELRAAIDQLMDKPVAHTRSAVETLDELMSQVILGKTSQDAARILEQLTAFLNLNKTYDNVEQIEQIKLKLTDSSFMNLILEQNLNNDNQQLLYEFFMALESGRAVQRILHWFRQENEPWKKLVLGELAVLSAGREVGPLVTFGLELGDGDACILLKGFGEIATQCQEPIFLKWSRHRGLKTQKELLKIVSIANRPEAEVLQILEYFAYFDGTKHTSIRELAEKLLLEKQSIIA